MPGTTKTKPAATAPAQPSVSLAALRSPTRDTYRVEWGAVLVHLVRQGWTVVRECQYDVPRQTAQGARAAALRKARRKGLKDPDGQPVLPEDALDVVLATVREWASGIRQCTICGEPYVPNSGVQTTCGKPACFTARGTRNARASRGAIPLENRVCALPDCTKVFVAGGPRAKFCSPEHRQAFKTAEMRRYRAEGRVR